jgi:hypothetical protein
LPANGLYTRANPTVVSQDLKTYDHGLFQIAVSNAPSSYANQVLGELWVSYTIKLRKPKLFTGLGLGISRDVFVGNGYDGVVLDPSQAGQRAWFGLNPLRGQQNNIGCKITIPKLEDNAAEDGFKITFPASYNGYLRIQYFFRAPAIDFQSGPLWWLTDTNTGTGYQPLITGNVEMTKDLYATYNGWDPATQAPYPGSLIQCVFKDIAIMMCHVRVQPATNGIDNTIWFNTVQTNYSSGQIIQTQLDISEYNSGFSFRAANVSTSEAPILVNSSGTVTLPS